MSKFLKDTEEALKAEGFTPGSQEYENLLLEKKVLHCQELRSVASCKECPYIEFCSLYNEWVMKIKLKVK